MRTTLCLSLLLIGCSQNLDGKGNNPNGAGDGGGDGNGSIGDDGGDDDGGSGSGDDGGDDGGDSGGDDGASETCEDAPEAGTVRTESGCEYVPESSGAGFSAKIEWSMAHALVDPSDPSVTWPAYTFADAPTLNAVFQAPAVGQATDDDSDGMVGPKDTPDIAIITGDEFSGEEHSALRLVSGDGSAVWDTVEWASHSNGNGTDTYAPFLFAGLAMGDVDLDGLSEIVTTVIGEDSGLCYPAIYEVSAAGQLSLDVVGEDALWCQGSESVKSSHAPALADIDADGTVEVILGRSVFEHDDLSLRWEGDGGRGWYNAWFVGVEGYWNSGYHSFAYDMDGDGLELEVVAGSSVYTADGGTYCELGRYSGSTWIPAEDGYPAVADMVRFTGSPAGEPEIVLTGNQSVSLYHGVVDYDPYGYDRCIEVDSLTNDPYETSIASELPAHPDCDRGRSSFGGPPTIADFTGDGSREVGVAGACWFTIYDVDSGGLQYAAMTQTRDWSSASTGATVFDFNGDGTDEVVFSDEEALYVWEVTGSGSARPWERFSTVLEDTNHKSWTIHEYPLVADVDGDGKSELLVVNSPRPDYLDQFGFYVIGASDDDWVSARPHWNQHAYFITNIDDDGTIGVADPNYAPYTAEDYNSFRLQAPGAFGALAAPNLAPTSTACQTECGADPVIWVQVANTGEFISADPGMQISLYGRTGSTDTLLDTLTLGDSVGPGDLSAAVEFTVPNWMDFDTLVAFVDDPDAGVGSAVWGASKECDEDDNQAEVDLSALCE
jgi:hypothetical protein